MDQRRLVHELQMHQIELEIQNEELTQTLVEVNALRAKYLDLYDFAPVDYFTLDTQGNILELNWRAAKLLGQERKRLVGRPLREFFDLQTNTAKTRFSRKPCSRCAANPCCYPHS
jgi:PAS domain-containing protein